MSLRDYLICVAKHIDEIVEIVMILIVAILQDRNTIDQCYGRVMWTAMRMELLFY